MSLGSYESEVGRGNLLNALAHPSVVNPAAAIGNAVQTARGIADLRTTQFNLQQAQLQPGYQAMRMLMATNPNPTWDDVNASLAQSARIGGNVNGLVANAAEIAAKGGKPADFVRATALGGMSPESQGTLAGPQMQQRQTEQGTYYGTTGGAWSPNANVFSPTGFVTRGLSPGQATEFVTVTGADGRPYQVPRGTLFGGGTGVGAGDGSGGGGGPATGGGSSTNAVPAGPPPGSNIAPNTPLSQKDADLATFAQRESGNQNIFSKVPVPQGYTQDQGGSGYYQIIPSTWAEGQQLAGIPPAQQTKLAIQASPQQQYQVASALYDKYGGKPWAQSAPQGQGGGGPPASGAFIGATATQPAGGGGMQYFPASPGGGGGGAPGSGGGMPGVQRGPGGAPILTPPSPYELPQFEQSSKDYVADQVNNRTLSRRIAPLQNTISIIKDNPGLVTGPSADNWYQWVQGLAAATGIDVGDVHNANAYNELTKQLAMNLQQSGADPTDMARLMHEASQPNTTQGRQAIVTLAAEQIGYQRMKSAQYLEFRSRHPTDANTRAQFYNQETGDWASQQDPMAYAADLIPQAELQAHLRGLNPDQQRAFVESLTNAKRLFKFQLPAQQGGQGGG